MMLKSKKAKIFAVLGTVLLLFFVVVPPFTRSWYRNHLLKYAPPIPVSSWKKFSSPEGKFSILFPGTPKETNQFVTNSIGATEEHMFYVNADLQDTYIVGYVDNEKFEEAGENGKAESFLEATQSLVITKEEGKVLFEQKTTFGNYPAREFEYKAGGKANYSVRVKYVMVGRRIYSITTVFLTGNPYLEDRAFFFNSFRLQN